MAPASAPPPAASRSWLLPVVTAAVLASAAGAYFVLRDRPGGTADGAAADPAKATYVGGAACARCHENYVRFWRESDHARAMEEPGPSTVLGDFDNQTFTEGGVTTTFFRRDGKYFVRTDGADGALQDFEIAYTFGFRPLQQYLVAFPGGRYQALSVAWDSRPKEGGGQRWFHLYPGQGIRAGDPLHWTGPNQNWNYMCADCHSTNLRRNYDVATNTYNTTWTDLNTNCEACHGAGSAHVAWAEAREKAGLRGRDDSGMGLAVQGLRAIDWGAVRPADMPELKKRPIDRARQQAEVQACAPCHSRRGPIQAVPEPRVSFLDNYRPALLDAGLYQADGQFEEEDYEYGSFLQSKMYAAGVTCSDCHNPHTGKLRVEGNLACTHCHLPEAYDAPLHTKHKAGTEASKCRACHMASRTYMVVDPRYDHSFRVPRPDYSEPYGVANACTTPCHTDRSAAWASAAIVKWYGPTRERGNEYVAAFSAARKGASDAEARLAAAATNADFPGIARATAVSELRGILSPASLPALQSAAADQEPLVRAAAAQTIAAVPPPQRAAIGRPLLADPVRLVRAWAASSLAGLPPGVLPPDAAADLEKATREYVELEMAVSERPEAHVNLGTFYLQQGRTAEAEQSLRQALRLDPSSVPARVNLADLYRATGRDAEGRRLLEEAVKLDPAASEPVHALGLLLTRQQQPVEALAAFKRAYELAPGNARYGYVYAVALHSSGDAARAIAVLESVYRRSPGDADTVVALTMFERERGNRTRAREWAARLVALRPQDPQARSLLDELSR